MENKNMLTFSRFETFEQVEAFYNRIKPVREDGYSTSRNIRPIGDRSRKGERIIKVNNNTYALSDGYHYGDAVYTPWVHASNTSRCYPQAHSALRPYRMAQG
jgi:hypothetical protein